MNFKFSQISNQSLDFAKKIMTYLKQDKKIYQNQLHLLIS